MENKLKLTRAVLRLFNCALSTVSNAKNAGGNGRGLFENVSAYAWTNSRFP